MKKLLYILLGASFLLPSLASCIEDSRVVPPNPSGRLRLSVEVESLGGAGRSAGNTRSVASTDGEDTVGSLFLLFFDQTSDRSGQYIDYVEVNLPEGASKMNIDTSIDFTGKPLLDPQNAYNILAIANIGDNFYITGSVDDWMGQWENKSESRVMAMARGTLPAAIQPDGILMHGRMAKPAGETQAHLLLTRDVSRFDVTMAEAVRGTHDLVSASIWNAYASTSIWEQGVMGFSDPDLRTRYHYTVNSGDDTLIKGGLYAFENQVASPLPHDEMTTCLIVGLKDRVSGKTAFYRVNMTDNSGAQQLKRNYAYSLTVTGVDGPGASTEEIAYLGESNNLRYTIGQWNLDDNGLIVRDDYSLLSIPTKTVTFGKNRQTVELSIHTFSSLPSPAPLTVRSQTYRPVNGMIDAEIEGNTLIIEAQELPLGETERMGVIVLSYAGLEIALNVVQSGVHDDYLRVTLPDGGIPRFPAYAGISSGLVTVQATGPWTAKLYLDGFSFNPSTALSPVKEIAYNNALVVDDPGDATTKKFRIYTHSFNMGERVRDAFIVVSLDKDPDTYSAVIRLSQARVEAIHVQLPDPGNMPDGVDRTGAAAVFDGAGTGLEPGIEDNFDKFYINPGKEEVTDYFEDWNVMLIMNGYMDDTRYFEIVENVKTLDGMQSQNYVVVRPKGVNISGREYLATLRAQTNPGTFVDIVVSQKPAQWKLPATPASILAVGGESGALLLDAPAGMHYTVEIESISGATDHFAYVVDPSTPTGKYSKLKSRPVSEPFVVGFPKMIYPNLYSAVSAIVRVTVTESGDSKTFVITQNPPAQHRVNILNVNNTWGHISDAGNNSTWTARWWYSYNEQWLFSFRDNFGPGGTVRTNGTVRMSSAQYNYFNTVWPIVKDDVNFVHITRPGWAVESNQVNANTAIWNWITDPATDGVLFVNAEDGSSESTRQFSSGYIPGNMGLTGSGTYDHRYGIAEGENRVMDYVTKTGPFGAQTTGASTWWQTAGTTSRIDMASVTGEMVPILVNHAGGPGVVGPNDVAAGLYCALLIDPVRRIVVKVDSEMFNEVVEMTELPKNVQAWTINAAQYGSHFSEYFWDSPRYLMPVPTPQP